MLCVNKAPHTNFHVTVLPAYDTLFPDYDTMLPDYDIFLPYYDTIQSCYAVKNCGKNNNNKVANVTGI